MNFITKSYNWNNEKILILNYSQPINSCHFSNNKITSGSKKWWKDFYSKINTKDCLNIKVLANSHLENISEYFEKVNSHLVLTPFYDNNRDSAKQIPLYELRDNILKKYDWIEFNKESNDLIDSFKSINSKIKKRIQEKVE
jgi:hypothetical protein